MILRALLDGLVMSRLRKLYQERLEHFARRIVQRGDDPAQVVIALVDVDSTYGTLLADILMPGYDWASIRAIGERPVARGLALVGLLDAVEIFSPGCRAAFDEINHTTHAAVVTVSGSSASVSPIRLPAA